MPFGRTWSGRTKLATNWGYVIHEQIEDVLSQLSEIGIPMSEAEKNNEI